MVILDMETGNEEKSTSVAKLTATTLSNVPVVGLGPAFFDQRWCALVATGTFAAAAIIEWRIEDE